MHHLVTQFITTTKPHQYMTVTNAVCVTKLPLNTTYWGLVGTQIYSVYLTCEVVPIYVLKALFESLVFKPIPSFLCLPILHCTVWLDWFFNNLSLHLTVQKIYSDSQTDRKDELKGEAGNQIITELYIWHCPLKKSDSISYFSKHPKAALCLRDKAV